jgi:hypothetical protein
MRTWIERHTEARRHVTRGQHIIDGQRILIGKQKALGRDTTRFEELLAAFERSQAIFEADLARIRQECK